MVMRLTSSSMILLVRPVVELRRPRALREVHLMRRRRLFRAPLVGFYGGGGVRFNGSLVAYRAWPDKSYVFHAVLEGDEGVGTYGSTSCQSVLPACCYGEAR